MAKSWSNEEYTVTDAAYQNAIECKKRRDPISRSDILHSCRKGLPNRDPSSIGPHLGNLTAARSELGLPILDEIAPFAHRPEKLVSFLKLKYRLR